MSKVFWDTVVDRDRKQFTRWKANCPSFKGKITLIKATLSNLPIYYLSLFKKLKGIAPK